MWISWDRKVNSWVVVFEVSNVIFVGLKERGKMLNGNKNDVSSKTECIESDAKVFAINHSKKFV